MTLGILFLKNSAYAFREYVWSNERTFQDHHTRGGLEWHHLPLLPYITILTDPRRMIARVPGGWYGWWSLEVQMSDVSGPGGVWEARAATQSDRKARDLRDGGSTYHVCVWHGLREDSSLLNSNHHHPNSRALTHPHLITAAHPRLQSGQSSGRKSRRHGRHPVK